MGEEYESPYTADVPDSQNGFLNDRETDLEDIEYDTLCVHSQVIENEELLDGQQLAEEYEELRHQNIAVMATDKVNNNLPEVEQNILGYIDFIGSEYDLGCNTPCHVAENVEQEIDYLLKGKHGQDTAVRFYQVPAPVHYESKETREVVAQLGQSAQTIQDSDWIKRPYLLLESREPETAFGEPEDARQAASVYKEQNMDEVPLGFLIDFNKSENPSKMVDILPDGSIHKIRGAALDSEDYDLPGQSFGSVTLKDS